MDNRIPKFRRCVIQNFPFIEDDFDALVNYGLMSKIVEYLNKVIKQTNETTNNMEIVTNMVTELKNYVDTYFDNLDVQEEINNKLDEMAEQGTLATLVSEYLENSLLNGKFNKSPVINYARIMRRLKRNSTHPDSEATDYWAMQGGCYLGNNIFVQASIRSGYTKLEKFNLTNDTLIANNVLSLGHCNSITFDGTYLYCTSLNDGDNQTHYLYKVDPSSLALVETIEFDSLASNVGVHSVAYDPITEKMYIGCEEKTTNIFTLYEVGANNTLTDCELVNYKNVLGTGGGTNDICVNNGILYILKHHASTIIATYDIASKNCLQIFNVPLHNEMGYGIGEAENISYDSDSGDLIIGAYKLDCKAGWYYMHNYFRTNLEHGIQTSLDFNASNTYGDFIIYVDDSSTSINPDGTNSNPFKTIGEALEIFNRTSFKSVEIYIRDGEYPFVYMEGLDHIKIGAANTASDITIKGIKIAYSNIEIMRATVEGIVDDYDIDIRDSNVLLTNIVLTGTHDEHIYLAQSTFKFITLTISAGKLFKLGNDVTLIPEALDDNSISVSEDSATNATFTRELIIDKQVTLDSTGHTVSTANLLPLITTAERKIRVAITALYGAGDAITKTQTTDGGNRNVCITIASRLITIRLDFDHTNKTITPKITKCIKLLDLTPVEETITGTVTLYVEP